MKQYQELLNVIKSNGTYKPAARENMPGTLSLFGYQFRHNLAEGFPLLTTKKMFFKGVVVELLWFLRGDTNIKYLIDNGVNIWNEDAYQYYLKRYHQERKKLGDDFAFTNPANYEDFLNNVKLQKDCHSVPNYQWGDCGFQYGKVWRDWEGPIIKNKGIASSLEIDQIKNLIKGLINNPESRRHIVTAIDPANDNDLALYWCHAMFQFNCRPLTALQRSHYAVDNNIMHRNELMFDVEKTGKTLDEQLNDAKIPKYYLDCQLYQRSADVFLGVPFNIASYALLTEIIAKMVGMIPGEFIHTFGDVHIYDNHKEAVEEQLKRTPKKLPAVKVPRIGFDDLFDENIRITDFGDFELIDYNPDPSIKAELSTGLKK